MNAHTKITAKVLNFYGAIGLDITPDELRSDLANLPEETPLHINLNSPGGSALDGFEIRQILLDWSGHKTIEVKAIAASAATVIATAGDYVIMNTGSLFMIHEPSSISFGTKQDHQKSINMLDGIGGSAIDVYRKKSGLPKKQCEKLMYDETWMTASEAVQLGFADEVKGASQEEPPLFDYKSFKNAPIAMMAFQKDFPLGSTPLEGKTEMTTTTKKPDALPSNGNVVMTGTGLLTHAKSRAEACGLNDTQSKVVMTAVGKIDGGATDQNVSDEITKLLATSNDAPQPHHSSTSMNSMENTEFSDQAIQDALLAKLENRRLEETEAGSYFQDLDIPQMAIKRAILGGVAERDLTGSRGLIRAMKHTPAQMSGGGFGYDDFAGITAPVIEKYALGATQAFISDLSKLSMPHSFDGYNKSRFIKASGMDDLPENSEHDTIQFINLGEDYEDVEAGVNAGQISVSEKLLRGDTVGALQSQINNASRAAAGVVNKKNRAAIFADDGKGAKFRDGNALFDASRNNLAATGTALSVESLSQAEKFILTQKIGQEIEPAGFKPKYLLVGPELKTVAQKILADITPTTTDEVNPFAGALELLVEPAITDSSWRLFTDKNQAPVLASGYMDGANGPQVDTEESFDVLGMKFRIIVRYGAGLVGFYGAFMNEGA